MVGEGVGRKEPTAPFLVGRTARCGYHSRCGTEVPSHQKLAFFEYRGEGSKDAVEKCRHCRYFEVAHKVGHHDRICDSFEPNGAFEFDSFYCGCRGWD